MNEIGNAIIWILSVLLSVTAAPAWSTELERSVQVGEQGIMHGPKKVRDKARRLFKQECQENYIDAGAGKVLTLECLT